MPKINKKSAKKKPAASNGQPHRKKKCATKMKATRPALPPVGCDVWVGDPDGGYDGELLQILGKTCRVETKDGQILRPLTEWLSHTDNFDLAVCRERGLTDDTIRENRLRTEGDAMIIPFRNLAGEMNGFARKRHHAPPIINGKPAKFTQPKGSPVRPYFPVASLEKLRDCFSPVFITESDLKAMVLAQLDLAGVGLTGVNCWNEKGTDNLIPDLQDIRWRDRIVYICFDYDEKEVTRRTVRAAMRRLARALRLLGAEVYFVDLPPAEDGGKQGVDDFIVANGAEAFHDLIEQAQPVPDEEISLINLISLTPPTLAEEAYHGFMGEFIKAVSPLTEATDAGILAHLIPALGTIIGPGPYVWGGDRQPARFNTVVAGPTSSGRKGTSAVPVKMLMETYDSKFWAEQYVSGLSTGEGVIAKVSDKKIKNDHDQWETIVADKRLYVLEVEFSKVLMQIRRDGNILSQVLRECFDSGNLGILTRSNPLQVQGAHVCVTAHITPEELQKRFSQIEQANGFGNRFLWFAVRSDKELPDARPISSKLIGKFSKLLGGILEFTDTVKLVKMDRDAMAMWKKMYSHLRTDRPGFCGALTARGESIV